MNHILPALTKLFNLILNAQYFPNVWNIAYQIPLFKDGDCSALNNVRCISITSCLGMIFNKAMNNRLQNKIEEDKKLEDSHVAYRSDHSTVDQIFIFKCLLIKYTKLHNRILFTCFVGFKKAFDSIWHAGLLFKLLEYYNIGGQFMESLKVCIGMQNHVLNYQQGLQKTFQLQKGIKLGHTLSPYLFNLYLNDAQSLFNAIDVKPPNLAEQLIDCLLYADYLLIISKTQHGLQTSLNKLHKYCQT